MMGGADEFVPKVVHRELLVKRMAAAVGENCKAVIVEGGNHKLEGSEQKAVDLIAGFLQELS